MFGGVLERGIEVTTSLAETKFQSKLNLFLTIHVILITLLLFVSIFIAHKRDGEHVKSFDKLVKNQMDLNERINCLNGEHSKLVLRHNMLYDGVERIDKTVSTVVEVEGKIIDSLQKQKGVTAID